MRNGRYGGQQCHAPVQYKGSQWIVAGSPPTPPLQVDELQFHRYSDYKANLSRRAYPFCIWSLILIVELKLVIYGIFNILMSAV